MSAKRLDMHRLQELVRLHRSGRSSREIARLLRMGRGTIHSYKETIKEAGLLDGGSKVPDASALKAAVEKLRSAKVAPQQQSSVERWSHQIKEKLEKGGGPTAIFDYLRLTDEDFDGSLSAVKRFCATLRRGQGVKATDVVIPVETKVGDVAQVDFGYVGKLYDPDRGVARKAWVFLLVLSFSRHMVARIVFDQSIETWLRVHIECFQELGGVPETIVPDNLKSAVIRASFDPSITPQLNRSYRELARYYNFEIDPTPPRAPEKKGKVESGVKYCKNSYFAVHAPEDIETAKIGLALWVKEIAGQRVHGTTGRRPLEVFELEEKATLASLPDAPYELAVWKRAKVHKDSHISFSRELYSVPWKLIGTEVDVRVTKSSVKIYANDELVWTHDRGHMGARVTVAQHLPAERFEYRERTRSYWEERADELGEPVGVYVRAIFDSDDVLKKLRTAQATVSHLRKFPKERAQAACRRALYFGNYSYGAVKAILVNALDLEPLPGAVPVESPWKERPRFSRVTSPTQTDDNNRRSDSCPQEATTLWPSPEPRTTDPASDR